MNKLCRWLFVRSWIFVCVICLASGKSEAQTPKVALVLFHGANETAEDIRPLADSIVDTKLFPNVVAVKFNWKDKTIPDAAPDLFRKLDKLFDGYKFVLMGTSEGGLLADWIAKKVKASEGKIIRVITVNTSFDGKFETTSQERNTECVPPN